MIPKLICFLFGHILREKVYTGKSKQQLHAFRGWETVNYYDWRYNDICPRCGKKLK